MDKVLFFINIHELTISDSETSECDESKYVIIMLWSYTIFDIFNLQKNVAPSVRRDFLIELKRAPRWSYNAN